MTKPARATARSKVNDSGVDFNSESFWRVEDPESNSSGVVCPAMPDLTTFKLTLAYDGTGLVGWQRQA